ncbi:MAG: hypothetical protein VKN72_17710 [Nostocales cyanobacterium 94392]|nr:hypothetical protein [Nostocales cyanobacterium 94392]
MFPASQAPSSFEEWILRLYHFSSNPVESTHDFSPNLVQAFTAFWEITSGFPEDLVLVNWGK